MKRVTLIVALCFAISSIGQLTNSLPTSGPVGIGTDTPDPSKQLTVNGDAKIINGLEINENLDLQGQAILNTIVRMPGIATYAGALDEFQIIVTDSYGNITKIDRGDLMNGVSVLPDGLDGCTPGSTEAPQWYNAPYKLFTVCPEINVGVGTINPEFLLHVAGEAYAMQIKIGNKSAVSNALVSAYSVSPSQDLIELGTMPDGGDQKVKFKITNDGTVYAKEIRIRLTTDFPDYVFEKGYKLMSISNLASYIKENKHLPNIPSAVEIKEKGLGLADMQVRLVEKIEELTLYTIQLNEENQKLKDELANMSSEIEEIKALLSK